MRAIWTGAVGFGLVNIPVKIYSAAESAHPDLDMLDKRNMAHVKFVRVNEETGEEVPWEEVVKAYRYEDQYVVLNDKDFEKAIPEKSNLIDIEEFVEEALIDPIYFETPYYIEPGKEGGKAYKLLCEALKETGKVAVGTFVMRNREHVCMIRPYENMLLLVRLRFAEEIRDTKKLKMAESEEEIKPSELKMAQALIEQLTPKRFDMEKYKDTYDDALMEIIKAKAAGKRTAASRPKVVPTKTMDLMKQLKESLNRKKAS